MLRRAVTLIELVVVLGILALLTGLLLGGIQHIRESAQLLRSENNLKQIGLAQANYVATAEQRLPPLAEGHIITKSVRK